MQELVHHLLPWTRVNIQRTVGSLSRFAEMRLDGAIVQLVNLSWTTATPCACPILRVNYTLHNECHEPADVPGTHPVVGNRVLSPAQYILRFITVPTDTRGCRRRKLNPPERPNDAGIQIATTCNRKAVVGAAFRVRRN